MTHTEEFLIGGRCEVHICLPGTVAAADVQLIPAHKAILRPIRKHTLAMAVIGHPTVPVQDNGQLAAGHGNVVIVIGDLGLRLLRHQIVILLQHAPAGKRLEPNGIFSAGCQADQFALMVIQNFVVTNFGVIHGLSSPVLYL